MAAVAPAPRLERRSPSMNRRLAPVAAAAALALWSIAPAASAQLMYVSSAPTAFVNTMSEDDMQYTVAKALAEDDSLKGASITLRIVAGRVLLEGVVFSDMQAKQALAVAESVLPPELVASRVEVAR